MNVCAPTFFFLSIILRSINFMNNMQKLFMLLQTNINCYICLKQAMAIFCCMGYLFMFTNIPKLHPIKYTTNAGLLLTNGYSGIKNSVLFETNF